MWGANGESGEEERGERANEWDMTHARRCGTIGAHTAALRNERTWESVVKKMPRPSRLAAIEWQFFEVSMMLVAPVAVDESVGVV